MQLCSIRNDIEILQTCRVDWLSSQQEISSCKKMTMLDYYVSINCIDSPVGRALMRQINGRVISND